MKSKFLSIDELRARVFNSLDLNILIERSNLVTNIYDRWSAKVNKDIKFSYHILKVWVISMIFLVIGYIIPNNIIADYCFLTGMLIFLTIFLITYRRDRRTRIWKNELIEEANKLLTGDIRK